MPPSPQIHWLRILLAGFLAELSVFAVVLPALWLFGQQAVTYAALAGSLAFCFLFALWLGRYIESRFVLHGILVGVVAMLLYIALTRAHSEPLAFLIAHALKLIGGAAGGYVAARRKPTATATAGVPA